MTQQTPADTQREVTDRDLREALFQMQRRHPANHMEIGFAMRLARDLIREREASAQVHGMWKLAVEMVEQRDKTIEQLKDESVRLREELRVSEKQFTLADCKACRGSGTFQDSEEGGIWVKCHCWANLVRELRQQLSALAQPGASGVGR